MILGAVGWESAFPVSPRSAEWAQLGGLLGRVLGEGGITWEVVAGFILEEGVVPFHFTRRQQEELIELDQAVGQEIQLIAANMHGVSLCYRGGQWARAGVATEYASGPRGRHLVQIDKDGGFTRVNLGNFWRAREYLSGDDQMVLSRRRDVAGHHTCGRRVRVRVQGLFSRGGGPEYW
ncbi:hypothetical protein CYMTET_14184 [Cymbomonas tetramitiformis]|uniref:Uncharacterized protein n=1 Tax=Cymbomonas tetramitiformis TaxID=36881 RepID=A0AAE0LA98_9CHLO|nr:hypothetical protein CYMTET_14184 [Cymbomonas tetramitiformis]